MTGAFSVDFTVLESAPAHWERRPLWTLIHRRDIINRPDSELLSVYRDHGIVPKSSRDDNFNKPSEDLSSYRYVRPGDLVLNKMKTWQGSLAVSQHEGIVSPAYYVCGLSPEVNPRFAHHLLRSRPYIHLYQVASQGIRPNQWDLPFEEFQRIPMLLPPIDEQRRIADFLDAETARIDLLVKAISESSNLLQAKRQALLMSAFPGQGCPTTRLGYYLDLVTSGPRGWGDYVGSRGTPFFRSANLRRDGIEPNLEDLALADPPLSAAAEAARSRVRVGDVLVGITGANTGWISLADQRIAQANVSQHVCLVRPGKMIYGRWLAYALSAPQVQELLLGSQYGGTKTQLSLGDVRDLIVPLPPLSEQQRIMMAINEGLAAITAERALRDRQLSVLAERRQALITAVVTGQIDVRTAGGIAI